MKRPITRVLMLLCCAALDHGVAPGQSVAAPVLVREVKPEYGLDLSKVYILEPLQIQISIAQDGEPFELFCPAGIPDNVVEALAQWRFEPGKDGRRKAAFRMTFTLPVRRPLNKSVEAGLRRHWSPGSKEERDAVEAGTTLDAAGARQFEQTLRGGPDSLDARTTLLSYFAGAPAVPDDIRQRRGKQIAWLVENLPDAHVLDGPLALINTTGEPLADRAAYERVRDLWLSQLSRDPSNASLLAGATSFLRAADSEKAEQALVPALNRVKEAAVWLGDIFGLALVGVTALDLRTGVPLSAGVRLPDTAFARRVRATLEVSTDARIVLSTLATVTAAGNSLAKLGRLPDGYAPLCAELLDRARLVYPGTSATCDPPAPPPSPSPDVTQLRVGGNVVQAKLIKQARPVYPPGPRSHGMQGTVRFNATISKTGDIVDLELAGGPLAFYKSARDAVSQWKYQPTLLNGQPVEILTQIDVNYTIGR